MKVIGVRFENAGKMYYFDPLELEIEPGGYVVVETARGMELGEVVSPVIEMPEEKVVHPLKPVLRLASKADLETNERNKQRVKEAAPVFNQKVAQHRLAMKLVNVEYAFDGSKIIFFFTANGRVDFRELVKDLASVFHMRIELRQIGVRDEAKMLGGLGPCGRPNCCGVFLRDFQSVSIKMAKEQNLSLNPTKISGLCGRLMCCLNYEQDFYEAARKRMPRVGKEVITPNGNGMVIEANALKDTVKVRIQLEQERAYEIMEFPSDQVRRLHGPASQEAPAETSSEEPKPPQAQEPPLEEEGEAVVAQQPAPAQPQPEVQQNRPPRQQQGDARPQRQRRGQEGNDERKDGQAGGNAQARRDGERKPGQKGRDGAPGDKRKSQQRQRPPRERERTDGLAEKGPRQRDGERRGRDRNDRRSQGGETPPAAPLELPNNALRTDADQVLFEEKTIAPQKRVETNDDRLPDVVMPSDDDVLLDD